MRRPVVSLSVGVLALAGACATSTGTATPTRYGAPTAERPPQPTASQRDSMVAQAIADREGPRVDVHAIITQASSSRRVRAAFNVEDDSYVLIGQVDGSGTVRIIFPTDPRDDGFVTGGKRYETSDVFAGFADEYRYRFNYARYYQHGLNTDAYDGSLGYMFIVASWRPMHFDRFSSDGVWDSYEMADEESLRDPKPAIYELASLLVGENREAYTVKFARYYNTDAAPQFGNAFNTAYAYGYGPGLCGSGFGDQIFGWSNAFFPGLNSPYEYDIVNGLDFNYRGTNYYYSPVGDCYYQSSGFYGRGLGLPVVPLNPNKPRMIAATDAHRPPVSPRRPPKVGPLAPQAQDVNAAAQLPRTSPTYRQRGLLTDDDTPLSGRREPRAAPLDGGRTRPAIQQMVGHRMQEPNNTEGWSRATTRSQASDAGSRGWTRPTAAGQTGNYNPPRMRTETGSQSPSHGSTSGYSAPSRYDGGARSAPAPRSEPSSSGGGHVSAPASSSSSSSAPAKPPV